MPRIREFDPERDLPQLAAFFNRNSYGPVTLDVPLTEQSLRAVLNERAVRLLLVGEDRGQIVGTVGYARMSGRRVAPDRELFAGMFVIAPSHRTSLLAGRLLTESFERLMNLDVYALRVEVDPANRHAYPLYLRVGFRALDQSKPDEDGYLELISLLPGVISELISNAPTWLGLEVGRKRYSWRTIQRARHQTLDSGVSKNTQGIATVSYEFQVAGHQVVATARCDGLGIEALTLDGKPAPGFVPRFRHAAVQSASRVIEGSVGDFLLHQDRAGILTISHADHLGPLVIDPFPVMSGTPAGPRRPAEGYRTTTQTPDGWSTTDGSVTRNVELSGSEVRISVSAPPGTTVTGYPWAGFRIAELELTLPRAEYSAPAVRGIWPLDFTDFESVADEVSAWPAKEARINWSDYKAGIELALTPEIGRTFRLEGMHALHLSGTGAISYRITLTSRDSPPAARAHPDGSEPAAWVETRRGGRTVLESHRDGDMVIVVPDGGLIEWSRMGLGVLTSTFPSRRRVGPFDDLSTAAWLAVQSDRTALDTGAEWSTHDPSFAFDDPAAARSWTVRLVPEDNAMLVAARAAANSSHDTELALYLLAPERPPYVVFEDSAGMLRTVNCGNRPWRLWTRFLQIPGPGGFLHLGVIEGISPEILVRSGKFGVIATAFSRLPRGTTARATWKFRWEAVA